MFYWLTIMFSQTLGIALGDWTADTAGLGYRGGTVVGDHLDKSHRSGGLAFSRYSVSAALLAFMVQCAMVFKQRAAEQPPHA